MSTRWSMRRVAALVSFGVLCAASAIPLGAQVAPPQKKAAVDTTKKAPAKKIVKKRAAKHVTKETAGGEVALPKATIDQDSLDRALAAVRQEEYNRAQEAVDRQRTLDSVDAAFRLRRALQVERNASAKAIEHERAAAAAKAAETERENALALKRHLTRGFYLGLAGGMSAPQRDIRNGYTTGWNTTVPFGWDANDLPLGVRTDFSVDRLGGTSLHDATGAVIGQSGAINVWSLNADLKLRMHAPGTPSRTHLYALGGIGGHRVNEGVYGATGTSAGQKVSFGSAKTSFGWNAGGGIAMQWGSAELFAESRFFSVKSDLPYHNAGGVGTYTSFTPIIIGLQWF